ncbi:unnamed protein product [Tilletia controversa]|uniref:DNA 3'-5' helicase n=1 Tax=Tilletia controversa TaxID=13291 RepID=A0A8X7MMX4_9BASI|nr:hypothetical protein A4X06_0g6900 [Tilletia controversa]CAD6934561.1 unnamed protein product [Tilletia controversa]CAD6938716.1 unnamed protein product [Tilletia controversa]CAD6980783.1 unnamed protein product [Tilletia controversa]
MPIPGAQHVKQRCFEVFKHQAYDWQVEDIVAILRGRDLLLSAGTGSGKSLVFQAPALFLDDSRFGVIVSPLISLIMDQAATANALGIPAAAMTGQSLQKDPTLLSRIAKGQYKLIFSSPELLLNNSTWLALYRSGQLDKKISYIAVDEAHCIHTWGSSGFRMDFSDLGNLRVMFAHAPIAAVSATFSAEVCASVYATLRFDKTTLKVDRRPLDRPILSIACASFAFPVASMKDLLFLLQDRNGGLLESADDIPQAIVFVNSRAQTVNVAEFLSAAIERVYGHPGSGTRMVRRVVSYHSRTDETTATGILPSLRAGALKIIVATDVFGMGIDAERVVPKERVP